MAETISVRALHAPREWRGVAIKDLIEAGAVTPVIDWRYPLSEVPDAIRYLKTMRARGKVVITV